MKCNFKINILVYLQIMQRERSFGKLRQTEIHVGAMFCNTAYVRRRLKIELFGGRECALTWIRAREEVARKIIWADGAAR